MLTVLITGSTDGIGLETAKRLASAGHRVLLHGRSSLKLKAARDVVPKAAGGYLADLTSMSDVVGLAEAVSSDYDRLDVLINNAGVLKTAEPRTAEGLDARFMVNTVAPYVLCRKLLPRMTEDGRIVNLSSAAQAPIDMAAFTGDLPIDDPMDAYAQSKLAITLWSRVMAEELSAGPTVVAVNPGSLLGTNMVREGFGIAGNDVGIGADVLVRAATAEEFGKGISGQYYDNDAGSFAPPHPAAMDERMTTATMRVLDSLADRAPAPRSRE